MLLGMLMAFLYEIDELAYSSAGRQSTRSISAGLESMRDFSSLQPMNVDGLPATT